MSNDTCSIDGCNRAVKSRGWCAAHYRRWRTTGDVQADNPIRHRHEEIVERRDRRANYVLPESGPVECTRCRELLDIGMFDKNAASKSGIHPWCKSCRRESRREYYKREPKRAKTSATWAGIKSKYGLTRAEYEAMHERQGGACAICRRVQSRRLSVDHDHACCPGAKSCGECVRALLCTNCNSMIGLADDNVDRLDEAIAYLRRWSK